MSALCQIFCRLAANHAAADYEHLFADIFLAAEQILCRNKAAVLKTRNRKYERIRAACKYDYIRLKLL